MKNAQWWCLAMLLCSQPLLAHSFSNAYLNLSVAGSAVTGQLRLRLQDVPWLVNLDSNHDLQLGWGELQAGQAALQQVVQQQFAIAADQQDCPLRLSPLHLQKLNTGVFVALPFVAQCPAVLSAAPQQLVLNYSVLMRTDASHRGIVELHSGDKTFTEVFTPTQQQLTFDFTSSPTAAGQLAFVQEGIWHIWTGYDHLLFLLALLLPLFVARDTGLHWHLPAPKVVMKTVLWTLTAFTFAHSLMLLLATLLELQLASAVVETLIAITVALSGVNVIYPIFSRNHGIVVFCFGLVHGLGFAGALRDLTLPTEQFVQNLLSFNIGVEAGQLALGALCFPLLLYLRNKQYYQRLVQPLLALGIFSIGIAWAFERGVEL
jgi:HupE / UreJ protein